MARSDRQRTHSRPGSLLAASVVCLGLLALAGCNSPYPAEDERANVLYTSFNEEPSHLDTAIAYNTDALALLSNVVEPPLEYHFLKRPYVLVPLVAKEVPVGKPAQVEWRGETINAIVYTVRLREGVLYQDHPCFVEANRRLTERDARGLESVWDLPQRATRELVAEDFVFAIRRLCDPRLTCPIVSVLQENILGLDECADAVTEALESERARREVKGGALYNMERDEKRNPIRMNYLEFPCAGVRATGRYAFEIVLKQPYPQILYWMAMPFFAPLPPEAQEFFDQPALRERSILLDKNAIGTGPYTLAKFDPTNEIVLARNPNFREAAYPHLPDPDPSDLAAVANYAELEAAGMLDDVGKPIPMLERVVYRREPEWIPRWAKFRQGYYDSSGVSSDVFDQTIKLSSTGDSTLSDDMAAQGIQLYTTQSLTVNYFAFNMRDPVVGGLDEAHRKLRQAIGIAFDTEEQIAIFWNGRGEVAHSITPPGIIGHQPGKAGLNTVTHVWDDARDSAVRRPIEEAKRLLAEAGYEDGYGPDGQPLTLYFDNSWTSSDLRPRLRFVIKQFAKLGIRLESRTTDYNRFQEKVNSGSFQIMSWGWSADYPDLENFLFLLYGPNARAEGEGANSANYANPEFDEIFVRMRAMENGPEREALARELNAIFHEDAPWFGCLHGVNFTLVHDWYRNAYPDSMGWSALKYRSVDVERRALRRREWNAPRWQPPLILVALVILTALPAVRAARRYLKEA